MYSLLCWRTFESDTFEDRIKWSEDSFYYCSERNNVVVLFGTLKVQSFILTEVSYCGLLIVVTSSTFFKKKDVWKGKRAVSSDHQNLQPSICWQMYFVHLYGPHVYCALVDLDSSGSPGVRSTPGLTSRTQVVCVCVRAYTSTHPPTTLTPLTHKNRDTCDTHACSRGIGQHE